MASPPAMPSTNPYQIDNLIFALTTPPERTSKLAPRWRGPYRVCRVPNEYRIVYEDDGLERTIHINHAKPAKFTGPDLPELVPPTEAPHPPPLGYLPAGLTCRPPKPPAPPENPSVAPAPPAAPAENNMPSPAAAPANQHPEPAPPCRRSPRLSPEPSQAHAILSPPEARPPHSTNRSKMARTYPLTIGYNDSMGSKANPLSFASLWLVDLRNGHSQYLSTIEQLIDALPKMLDPASRFALRGHVARLRHSSSSLWYYLTRQGRRVVLWGGWCDPTSPGTPPQLDPWPGPHPSQKPRQRKSSPCSRATQTPRKMRPQRKRREHHQQPGASGSVPGTSRLPSSQRSTSVKHPQLPQLPQPHQPPHPAANENSSRAHLPDQPDPGRLYKRAHSSISMDSTTRSRRDNFSGSNLSFTCSQRSHRDYFSGSPCRALSKNCHMTDPLREAIFVSLTAVRESSDPVQTPPHAALPDVAIDVGVEPPEAAATSRIQHADRPPVVLEILCSSPEPSEPSQCPNKPGKRFQPPVRGSKRPRTNSPPSPCRPRKRPSSTGRWCEQRPPVYKELKTLSFTLF